MKRSTPKKAGPISNQPFALFSVLLLFSQATSMPPAPEIEALLSDPELRNLYSDFVIERLSDGEVKPFSSGM